MGGELTLPIALDYAIVQQALIKQLVSGDSNSIEVFNDGLDCNSLTLSDPRVGSSDNGLVSVKTTLSAQGGTPIGGRCMFPFSWQGGIETLQEVYINPDGQSVAFRVVDSSVITTNDNGEPMPSPIWNWVKSYIHPRLAAVTINLGPAMSSLQELLSSGLSGIAASGTATADTAILQSQIAPLLLKAVTASPEKLNVSLSLTVPDAPAEWLPPGSVPDEEHPLSTEELARWDQSWQSWDGFATWLIKTMAAPADPQLAQTLGDILLESRYQLRDALANDSKSGDPVRELFVSTWQQLAPLLRDGTLNIPGAEALQVATFISAADALQTLDSAAPYLGVRFDSQTFRTLARLILPTVSDDDLGYNTQVDPQLRALLGLDPEFDVPTFNEDTGEANPASGPFAWLIPRAEAANVDPKLIKKLTGWVPASAELDDYITSVNQLLEEITRAEREKGKVPVAYFPIYESLLLATAWQESCWRQYIDRGGKVQPILSSAGSVGMMQINQHVWRGIYDPAALHDNIAYNAKAGNEILVHYLVDYAIKKKEQTVTGDNNSLARATYAVYNGGPKHLTRYRNPNTSKGLRLIDDAFWKKYQTIRSSGASAVKSCYSY